MYIVIDSNIWIRELGLNSNASAAVKFFIKKNNHIIVVPEVVRLEVETNLEREIKGFIDNIKKDYNKLLVIFKNLPEIVLPDESAIKEIARSVFKSLHLEIEEIPFSFESAKSSFLKTIYKNPPSDKSQQFKDGVIWEDCVGLHKKDSVIFITSDKAFYLNHDYNKGLAENLKLELIESSNEFKLLPSLDNLLENIKSNIDVDINNLSKKYIANRLDGKNSILSMNGLCGESLILTSNSIKIFATEMPNELFISYKLYYSFDQTNELETNDIFLEIKGQCKYLIHTQNFIEFSDEYSKLYSKKDLNEDIIDHYVYIRAEFFEGHRTIKNIVRQEI
jgi:hypothetical protein